MKYVSLLLCVMPQFSYSVVRIFPKTSFSRFGAHVAMYQQRQSIRTFDCTCKNLLLKRSLQGQIKILQENLCQQKRIIEQTEDGTFARGGRSTIAQTLCEVARNREAYIKEQIIDIKQELEKLENN